MEVDDEVDTWPLDDDEVDEETLPLDDDETLPDDDEETLPDDDTFPDDEDVLLTPPVEVDEPPVEDEVDEPPDEVEVDPPLELDVEEMTIPLEPPPLPPEPPKKPPAKNPPPPKPPPPPPMIGAVSPPPDTKAGPIGNGTGTGAACEAIVTTAGAHDAVVVVTIRRTLLLRTTVRFTTRLATRGATFE